MTQPQAVGCRLHPTACGCPTSIGPNAANLGGSGVFRPAISARISSDTRFGAPPNRRPHPTPPPIASSRISPPPHPHLAVQIQYPPVQPSRISRHPVQQSGAPAVCRHLQSHRKETAHHAHQPRPVHRTHLHPSKPATPNPTASTTRSATTKRGYTNAYSTAISAIPSTNSPAATPPNANHPYRTPSSVSTAGPTASSYSPNAMR